MPSSGKPQPVELDGRTLEGGGQLLRIALALSALTGIPIKVTNIRGNRSGGGGLKAQHLACIKWLGHACNASVDGAQLKSKKLTFEPGDLRGQVSPAYTKKDLPGGRTMYECSADVGSAGSTALVLQAILPYILFAPPTISDSNAFVRLHISGGTNVSGSPSYEYVTQILLPTLQAIGLPDITANLDKRGWSDGRVSIGSFSLDIPVRSGSLPPFSLQPSDKYAKPRKLDTLAFTFLGPQSCHSHLRTVLLPAVQYHFGDAFREAAGNVTIVCENSDYNHRLYLFCVATCSHTLGERTLTYRLGSDWLYARKIRILERAVTEMAEKVALNMFNEWKSGAWVDEHMRDQLVIFSALSSGQCSIWEGQTEDCEPRAPSLHTQTAEWVVRQMLNRGANLEDQLSRLSVDQ